MSWRPGPPRVDWPLLCAAIAAAVALLWFAGCCPEPLPRCGVVVEKNHRGAWMQPMMTYNPALKMTTLSYFIHHPARWSLLLEGENAAGKTRRWSVSMRPAAWAIWEVGDSLCSDP